VSHQENDTREWLSRKIFGSNKTLKSQLNVLKSISKDEVNSLKSKEHLIIFKEVQIDNQSSFRTDFFLLWKKLQSFVTTEENIILC
jgi:hypothetical protein